MFMAGLEFVTTAALGSILGVVVVEVPTFNPWNNNSGIERDKTIADKSMYNTSLMMIHM